MTETLKSTAGCFVYPPVGPPHIASYELPPDLREFYSLCGGIDLFSTSEYGIGIVPPERLLKSNPVIAGLEGVGDISFDWFIIAASGGQHISIDLNHNRLGRCYDSFWDRHAVAGSSPVIARSFSELLERLVDSRGRHWFWLQPGFRGYGDAYDRPA